MYALGPVDDAQLWLAGEPTQNAEAPLLDTLNLQSLQSDNC